MSNTEDQANFRKRKETEGLCELRGVWVPKAYKEDIKRLIVDELDRLEDKSPFKPHTPG